VDDFQGAYEGALHLIRQGHRNIAYIEYNRPDLPSVLADRFIGFKKAIDEHSLDFPPHFRVTIDLYNMGELVSRLEGLLKQGERPTALFAHDDYLAARITVALGTLGLKVPDDVSIIAPGDTLDYNQPYIPRITTMKIDTDMLGKLAGELMINRLQNRPGDILVLKVKQQLVERGSCPSIVHKALNV
jgi:LacI family transcriptional regulator